MSDENYCTLCGCPRSECRGHYEDRANELRQDPPEGHTLVDGRGRRVTQLPTLFKDGGRPLGS